MCQTVTINKDTLLMPVFTLLKKDAPSGASFYVENCIGSNKSCHKTMAGSALAFSPPH
jgi:hypothetical protein